MNYSLVLQDDAQGFHWNNAQATIHPFLFNFKKSNALNTEHKQVTMKSVSITHNIIQVHTFQQH
jgi:hypothetical protein